MTKRQTQLFALLLLIGAPLIVSLLSGYFLPGIREIAPLATEPAPPAYMQPAPDPAAGLPPAQPDPPTGQAAQNGPLPNVAFNAEPVYNPSGISVQGVDPSAGAVMPIPGGGGSAAASSFDPGSDASSKSPGSENRNP